MKKKKQRKICLLFSVLAIIFSLYSVNPSETVHKNSITKELCKNGEDCKTGQDFCQQLDYYDCICFSITRFHDTFISIGFAKKVAVINDLTPKVTLND